MKDVHSGKRILIVDDEERVLFILSTALKRLKEDYVIEAVENGRDAISVAKEAPFDLLITDLAMPDINGVELTRVIQEIYPDIVVLWITAYGSHTVRALCRQLEIHRCLDKPLEINEFRQAVREALATSDGSNARRL